MTYPPPPSLIFMAYMYGKITGTECKHMMNLWAERHKNEGDGDADN